MIIPTEPIFYIKWTAIWVAVLTILVLSIPKEKYAHHSKLVFMLFVIPVMGSTLYLAYDTVNHNLNSVTRGPIHWHADYQIWACNERLDLVNPTGMKNKIGSPLFHEHDDDRIHVEGTVDDLSNVNLPAFFRIIGGELTSDKLVYNVEGKELQEYTTGDNCGDTPSELKIYVNGVKINNVETYMYYPHAQVPPGDCVIIEFGSNLPDTTERICDFWDVNKWNYENFKEKRIENPNYKPSWMGEGYEYVDGLGVIEVNK